MSLNHVDKNLLDEISATVDTLLHLSEADVELKNFSLKFQLEQAADKAAFRSEEKADRLAHMCKALKRMSVLALSIAKHVLWRTKNFSTVQSKTKDVSLIQASSVEDFSEGTDAWLETGAHLSYASVNLLATVLHVSPRICNELQMFLYEKSIIEYLSEALAISRDHELSYFQEGYRTEHVRLIANLAFSNTVVADSIAADVTLLSSVLSGTKIDEENPGLVEWSEFAVRNICDSSASAREKIKKLSPAEIDPKTKAPKILENQ